MKAKHAIIVLLVAVTITQTMAALDQHGTATAGTSLSPAKTVFGYLPSYLDMLDARILNKGDGRYVVPSDSVRSALKTVVRLIQYSIENDDTSALQTASEQAAGIKLQIVTLVDNSTRTEFFILRENDNSNRGWGYYAFTKSHVNLILEAPHPIADSNTSRVAGDIFQRSRARALLVAGAHRDAVLKSNIADVAHRWDSIFEAVHEEVVSRDSVVIQVHSFSAVKKVYKDYPEIVLSSGTKSVSDIIESLASNLRSEGFTVGFYDGFQFSKLSARSNVQGVFSRRVGAMFVHLEIELRIIENPSRLGRMIDAVVKSIDSRFGFPLDLNWKLPVAVFSIVGLLGLKNVVGKLRPSNAGSGKHPILANSTQCKSWSRL